MIIITTIMTTVTTITTTTFTTIIIMADITTGMTEVTARPLRLRFDPRWIVIGLCLAMVAWVALVPLAFLLWQSVTADGSVTLANFRSAYLSGGNAGTFANSVLFAIGAAVFSMAIGTLF